MRVTNCIVVKTRYAIAVFAWLWFIFPLSMYAQDDLEGFKERRRSEFQQFKDERHRQFAEFIRNRWLEYELLRGMPYPVAPSPDEIPVAQEIIPFPEHEIPLRKAEISEEQGSAWEHGPLPKKHTGTRYETCRIEFLGHQVEIEFDIQFRFRLNGLSSTAIADAWEMLARTDYESLLYNSSVIGERMALNDWAFYSMIEKLAGELYGPGASNEQTMFTAFILYSAGYRVKLAADNSGKQLLLLLDTRENLYNVPYFTFTDGRYYLIGTQGPQTISTFDKMPGSDKMAPLSLLIGEPMQAAPDVKRVKINSASINGGVVLDFNPHLISFYEKMPVCDLSVHFNSACSPQTMESIHRELTPRLAGLSDEQKVSLLLNFLHEGFPYLKDEHQFGEERYFFAEELLAYPFSDCEDNAVLFARLVRELTGLPVIGLVFDDHVAAAVKFDYDLPGSFIRYQGEKYMVCDPTYIGARIGQCMPRYENQPVQGIPVR